MFVQLTYLENMQAMQSLKRSCDVFMQIITPDIFPDPG